ncbi:MAG: PD-(D/E)XK nuclease family protein [Gemmataceae bacterium]
MARDERDAAAWDCLWGELRAWAHRSGREVIDPRTFARRLSALASRTPAPGATAEVPRVLVLSADVARYRATDYRFVLGLGERTFPRPAPEASLRDGDANADEHLSGEMLLFHEVVTGARRRLVLSYPAVDERGQELLPGSFLQAVEACFVPGAVEVEQRRMPIEGYLIDEALSPSELRARVGAAWPVGADRLPAELRAHLFDAAAVAQARFREPSFTPYDGVFTDPFIAEWAGRLFGPEKVLSPTALEDYIGCPFKFFLRHALRLEPLEDPREEVEVTRRGMAFHRALARLHTRLRDRGTHQPADGVVEEVLAEVRTVIDEDVRRAPGQVAKELWRLEGQRLLKTAGRYPAHWGKFLKPWLERGVAPRPHLFEADFGLPTPEGATPTAPLVLRHDGVEVRLWGRIDRVDLAELDDGLGFWVIDYKTGRSAHYTGTDLAEFRKVQLTLYALAVEAVVLAGRGARPLGLAYWLVSESGPKVALPGRNATAWLEEASRWPAIRDQLVAWIASLARDIRHGAFPLAPRSEHCTQTCPYGQVCRITQARSVGKVWDRPLPGEGKDA